MLLLSWSDIVLCSLQGDPVHFTCVSYGWNVRVYRCHKEISQSGQSFQDQLCAVYGVRRATGRFEVQTKTAA